MSNALVINAKRYPVEGVTIIAPDEATWAHLNREDGKLRGSEPQQWILHKTIADFPEVTIPGIGPAGGARQTAEWWQASKKSSGAHLVTGHDGITGQLEDLSDFCAWHGNQANDRAVGHEVKETSSPRGGCYQAAYDAAIAVTMVGMTALGIQWQCPSHYVDNTPLKRFADGGRTLIGCFGHRDITTDRNRHDPGDRLFAMLVAKGFEAWDFAAGQDRDIWGQRQKWLNQRGGYKLVEDGQPGPRTTRALFAEGFIDGIWAKGPLAEKPLS